MSKARSPLVRTLTLYVPLALVLLFVLIPIAWTVITSLKPEKEVLTGGDRLLPASITFTNYVKVWSEGHFSTYFLNSLFVALTSVFFVTTIAAMNGYALSRFKFRGRQAFMIVLLCTQLLPAVIFLVPLFMTFKAIHLINTPFSLIIFYTAMQVPFSTLLMKGFIGGIPPQIDEAAMVDGASRTTILFRIVMPLATSGLVATAAFAFIGCWNEFIAAFTLISSNKFFTVPVGLKFLIGEYDVSYASLAAGSVIALIPAVALFAYIQRFLVEGLGSGSVKG